MRHTTGSRAHTRSGSLTDVERLSEQIEAQRAELDALRAALEERRAEQSTSPNSRRSARRRLASYERLQVVSETHVRIVHRVRRIV